MKAETRDFMKRYSAKSVGNLVKSMCSDHNLKAKDLQELKEWLQSQGVK